MRIYYLCLGPIFVMKETSYTKSFFREIPEHKSDTAWSAIFAALETYMFEVI